MKRFIGVTLVGVLGVVAATSAQYYELASAQVVPWTSGPPRLKLSANGPIAFQVEPPDAETPVSSVRVRLYGVSVPEGAQFGDLMPFTVRAERLPDGSRLTITFASGFSGETLEVVPGDHSGEIQAIVAPSPALHVESAPRVDTWSGSSPRPIGQLRLSAF